jgi:hypothetical protein
LLLAVQVTVRLYATSTLSSAAYDAAEQVATGTNTPNVVATATADAKRRLGSLGARHAVFIWEEVDAERVVLRVEAQAPGFLPLPASFRRIDRTITVRTERFR